MLKTVFRTIAVAVLGASLGAQSASGKVFARYTKPLKAVTIDLATGAITRGPTVHNRSAATVADFFNNDLSGFVGVDTGNGFCEWFDAGVKGFAGNGSDLVSDVYFSYCSAMLTPASGGPGGSVKLGFYEGYTAFGGAATTVASVLTLTGLPGNTASSSFFGGFTCYFVRVGFEPMLPFRDGAIGYSWKFLDMGTDGALAGTWPALSCVVSCSGTYLQVDGQGMTDVIDQYCPPGTLRSTFTFGTTSGTFTSYSMQIDEVVDTASTITNYNACTNPNPDTLSSSNVVIGQTWIATVTRSPVSSSGTFVVRHRYNGRLFSPCDGTWAGPGFPTGPGGRHLLNGVSTAFASGTHDGTTGTVSAYVPESFSLVCLNFAMQAILTGGTTPASRISSAVEGTIGTF